MHLPKGPLGLVSVSNLRSL